MLCLHRSPCHSSRPFRSASGGMHTAMYHCSRTETVDMGLCCSGFRCADQTLSHSTLPHPVHGRAANGRDIAHSATVPYIQSSTSTFLEHVTGCIPLALEK